MTQHKYVILRSISTKETFFTAVDGRGAGELVRLYTGQVAYEILRYADTLHEAQTFLYGKEFADYEEARRQAEVIVGPEV